MNKSRLLLLPLVIVIMACSSNTPVKTTNPVVPPNTLADRPEMSGYEVVPIKPDQPLPPKFSEENECLKRGGVWKSDKKCIKK